MNFYGRRFNLYLLLAAALAPASGCALFHKEDKGVAIMRIHVESAGGTPDDSKNISLMRTEPVMVNIATEPILTEADIAAAALLETPGGFAVKVKFDEGGGLTLEQYSAINPGKHLAIFAQWGDRPADGRWLAAPLIKRLITDATLTFTPDASREEAEQLVKGLNLAAQKAAEKKSKQ
jgi:hypothetical protein